MIHFIATSKSGRFMKVIESNIYEWIRKLGENILEKRRNKIKE